MINKKLLAIETRKKDKGVELCFFDQVGKTSFFYEQKDTFSIFQKLVDASVNLAVASKSGTSSKQHFGIALLRAANIFIDSDFSEEIESIIERVLQDKVKQENLDKTIGAIKKLMGGV